MSAALLDMNYHTISNPVNITVPEFESTVMNEIGMIPEIIVRYRSTYFSHIFNNDYSAGYYSYIWAEVLDSDAFGAFREKGNLFDQQTAASFRRNILEKGHTDDPMNLFIAFRGREPDIKPMLVKRGLIKESRK
jgi:peptidyl-dipeptidase Dcp